MSTYSAFDILEFGEYFQTKSISLTSGPIPTIHIISKSQNQT